MTDSTKLRLRREADNQYDKNAVAVDALMGNAWRPIGYIAKDKNQQIADCLDKNLSHEIKLAGITGGGEKNYGVNIELKYEVRTADKAEIAPPSVLDWPKPEALPEGEWVPYKSPLLGDRYVHEYGGHKILPGYLSGSRFPKQFFVDFPKDRVLQAYKKKYPDVSSDTFERMWELKGTMSTDYGHAVHTALEEFFTYRKLGERLSKPGEDSKALSKNPFLAKIVKDFVQKFDTSDRVLQEQFIWNDKLKFCGSIDRLRILDAENNVVAIEDYKTDANMFAVKKQKPDSPFLGLVEETEAGYHVLQLSFYAYILSLYGVKTERLVLYWLNPDKLCSGENAWESYEYKPVDISIAWKGKDGK